MSIIQSQIYIDGFTWQDANTGESHICEIEHPPIDQEHDDYLFSICIVCLKRYTWSPSTVHWFYLVDGGRPVIWPDLTFNKHLEPEWIWPEQTIFETIGNFSDVDL